MGEHETLPHILLSELLSVKLNTILKIPNSETKDNHEKAL